jgi:hypothetical protein
MQASRTDALKTIAVAEVDYLHRTTKEFLDRSENQQMFVEASDSNFNEHATLAKCSIQLLSILPRAALTPVLLWAWLRWCSQCAAQAESSGHSLDWEWVKAIDIAVARLVSIKSEAGLTLRDLHKQEMQRSSISDAPNSIGTCVSEKAFADCHWANTEPGRHALGAKFTTFCIQNGLTTNIEMEFQTGSKASTLDDTGRPLLDYVCLTGSWTFEANAVAGTEIHSAGTTFTGTNTEDSRYGLSPYATKTTSLLLAAGADPINGTLMARLGYEC